MAPGNAVVAEWTGPSGMQLFDGTLLAPGTVITGIGKEEAEASDYWKVLGDVDTFTGDTHGDASSRTSDPSFGTEDGGGSTGRPLTDEQAADVPKALPRGKSKAADTSEADVVPATAVTE